jgi:hypothetical protein
VKEHYGLKGVLSMWKAGQLTSEQAIGQILQLLEIVELRLNDLERRQREQRQGTGQVNEISPRQEVREEGE